MRGFVACSEPPSEVRCVRARPWDGLRGPACPPGAGTDTSSIPVPAAFTLHCRVADTVGAMGIYGFWGFVHPSVGAGRIHLWGCPGPWSRHSHGPEKSQDRKGRTMQVGWESKLFGGRNVLPQAFFAIVFFFLASKEKKKRMIKGASIKIGERRRY